MGLKMTDDQDALASKILLLRAGNKSKAKSWLSSSLPDDAKDEQEGHDDLAEIHGDNENSGLGVIKKDLGDDDPSNRHLLSANDALRKKLLSKDAYRKYRTGNNGQLEGSKPLPKKAKRQDDIDSEEEGKGRATKGRHSQQEPEDAKANEPSTISSASMVASQAPSNSKKRASSYLDQLLAERGKKKRKSGRDLEQS